MDAIIKEVRCGSIAEECGIMPGDRLVSLNGKPICDILDYEYLSSAEELVIEVEKEDGTAEVIEVVTDYEDLGLVFEDGLIDPKSCHNKCIFCFIDQLPPNMRRTVYYKDDDYRLSALMGNYITLTNMKDEDFERIAQMHLPRINVSVHTTDPELRCRMTGNRFAGNIMERLRFLDSHAILMNCQIVLCRGFNDGEKLEQTVTDLLSVGHIQSVSVVPVGLTAYREGLEPLTPFDAESSAQVIAQIEAMQKIALKKVGSRFVYAADEFYVMAGQPVPPSEAYEDFLQIENGVGLLASFREEYEEAAEPVDTSVCMVTGEAAYRFFRELTAPYAPNLRIFRIKNRFFGGGVTVSGLLTAGDIIEQLKGEELSEVLLIPAVVLNTDGVFLDDRTVEDIEKALGVQVRLIENDGAAFARALAEEE